MKTSLATSTTIHALILGWALVTLGAPERFEVGNVETLPVSIVPIEELTQIQQGARSAPLAERAAPEPTTETAPVPDAQNIGNNTVDLDTPPTPQARPQPVEQAAAPQPVEETPPPEPEPTPAPEPEPAPPEPPAPEPEPEPAPEAPAEVAALPEPTPEPEPTPAPEPVPEAPVEAAPVEPEPAPQPDPQPQNIPTPQARPTPPRPEPPRQQQAAAPQPTLPAQESEFDVDEVAALLNREAPSGGGQQRSQEQAALGGRTTTSGEALSQSEMDALRGQIQRCWSVIPGMADAADVRVRVSMRLAPDGSIEGQPGVSASGGSEGAQRTLSGGALRAVMRCAPYSLPAEKYESWADVVVNFDPSQMF
jgi:hypothetical protein